MMFRIKKLGPRRYLQIVSNRREGGAVRQQVVATVGRVDELASTGGLASLLASGARLCEQVMLLSALDDPDQAPRLQARRIGAPLAFGRLWQETGCRAVIEELLGVPRPTVLRDTALQVEDCKEVEDGRGRWDGRGPVGARTPRWRRRVHARGPTTDVGAPQAGRRAEAVAG